MSPGAFQLGIGGKGSWGGGLPNVSSCQLCIGGKGGIAWGFSKVSLNFLRQPTQISCKFKTFGTSMFYVVMCAHVKRMRSMLTHYR